MSKKNKQPLSQKSHLPFILLGVAMAGYGVLTALVGSWLSNQAMRGVITSGDYRSRLAAFDQTAGFIAGIVFLALFIWCAMTSSGLVRAAFFIGALASAAPVLAARAERVLFAGIGLPTMGAGSVVAGVVTTLVFALPLTILFIMLASGRRVPGACRWLALVSVFIVLGVAVFPIYVTVMAFLVKPGDPVVGQMIEVSSQVIKLRYILPGSSFILLALLSLRFAKNHPLASDLQGGLGPESPEYAG